MIGTFSYQLRVWAQTGHREDGQTMDWWRGRRCMQTFRKLPMIAPEAPATPTKNDSITILLAARSRVALWEAGKGWIGRSPARDQRRKVRTACRADRAEYHAARHL